jgi:hypothetical protein
MYKLLTRCIVFCNYLEARILLQIINLSTVKDSFN